MYLIKEFHIYQKTIYGYAQAQANAKTELLDFVDDVQAFDGNWALTKNNETIYIKELKNGKYFGHDKDGNDVSGNISDLKDGLTNETKINF